MRTQVPPAVSRQMLHWIGERRGWLVAERPSIAANATPAINRRTQTSPVIEGRVCGTAARVIYVGGGFGMTDNKTRRDEFIAQGLESKIRSLDDIFLIGKLVGL